MYSVKWQTGPGDLKFGSKWKEEKDLSDFEFTEFIIGAQVQELHS